MLAGGEDDERVHLEAQLEDGAGRRGAGDAGELTGFVGDDFGKEIQVRNDVSFSETVFGQFDEEVLAGVSIEIVAGFLIRESPEFFCDESSIGAAADGVVPAGGV